MFHSHDGLFFGRKANGDVRILKFPSKMRVYGKDNESWPKADGEYYDAELDETLDQHSWCSVIASVCGRGETGNTFDEAKRFHGIEPRGE